jgi:hypothetical protein
LTRWGYRVRQFFTAVTGAVGVEEMAEARRVLGQGLYEVFAAMPRQYRRHALGVYGRVREAGCDDPVVWQAALLHDSGKYDVASGRYVTVLHRVAVVLLGAVPGGKRVLRAASRRADARGLSGLVWYPFYLSRHHARLGAAKAARLGAAAEVVRLIERHQEDAREDARLRVLQAADDRE